jgi:pentatricopeptide repeat protein
MVSNFGNILHEFWQGLSEQAVNAFRKMSAEGLTPSLVALNSLINAFGEDRRDAEAFAVLQYMTENVRSFSYVFSLFLAKCPNLYVILLVYYRA